MAQKKTEKLNALNNNRSNSEYDEYIKRKLSALPTDKMNTLPIEN